MSDIDISNETNVSSKSRLVACLLCAYLSWLGVHRFYVGKVGSGIAMILLYLLLLPLGWLTFLGMTYPPTGPIAMIPIVWLTFGIWHLVDWIVILTGSFKDGEGKVLKKWIVD